MVGLPFFVNLAFSAFIPVKPYTSSELQNLEKLVMIAYRCDNVLSTLNLNIFRGTARKPEVTQYHLQEKMDE